MVAIIEMEEGARILSLVTGDPPSTIACDQEACLAWLRSGIVAIYRFSHPTRRKASSELRPDTRTRVVPEHTSGLREPPDRPVARDWEHEGRYPTEIVSTMKDMGLFGDSMPLTNSATSTVVSQLSTNG